MDQFKENIISAVVSRDLSEVKRLLGPVDIHSTSLQPVLAKAFVESAGRDASILRWFLELGFDINAVDEEAHFHLLLFF
ncbi:hypothetical protein Ae201684_015751 [Aphanomyces euteiches]|uniref:Uncharacterized protein n=1 Tax=Aphanomyces euteiches TaxID=100861 RepID=A0A6G0WEF1_9STRA|nr:hypothetical protein Ae201684_015751 [Aphanomyces euteiches]